MTEYIIEHFQLGKLGNQQTRDAGASLGITAASSGIFEQIGDLERITEQLNISVQRQSIISKFPGAYGFKIHEGFAIIAFFQRSPTKEGRNRLLYFIQGHYAIIPLEILQALNNNLRPLFVIFTENIPYYNQTTELRPFKISLPQLVALKDSPTIPGIIPFVPYALSDPPVVFDHPQSSPLERLNFITELIRFFPPELRLDFPFITATDRFAPDKSFRLGFFADAGVPGHPEDPYGMALNQQFLKTAPKVKGGKDGETYMAVLEDWAKRSNITDQTFQQLRFPAAPELALLDDAAHFVNLYPGFRNQLEDSRKTRKALEENTLYKFTNRFIGFMNEGELQNIVDIVLRSAENDPSLYQKAWDLARLVRQLRGIPIPLRPTTNILGRLIQGRNPKKVEDIYSYFYKVEDISYAADVISDITLSISQSTFADLIKMLYQWHINEQVIPNTILLINTLIDNNYSQSVTATPWWIATDFRTDITHLSKLAHRRLVRDMPSTYCVLTKINQVETDQSLSEDWLANVYQELGNYNLVDILLQQVLKSRDVLDFLSPSTFNTWAGFVKNYPEASEHGLVSLERIGKPTIYKLATRYSRHFENLEAIMISLRDFILAIMHTNESRSSRAEREYLSDFFMTVFWEYSSRLCDQKNLQLAERDRRIENWAWRYRQIATNELPAFTNIASNNLFMLLPEAALVKVFDYPSQYCNRAERILVSGLPHDATFIYVWIVFVGQAAQYPRKLERLIFHYGGDFNQWMQRLFPEDGVVFQTYFIPFCEAVKSNRSWNGEWLKTVRTLPFIIQEENLPLIEQLVANLQRVSLVEQADSLQESYQEFLGSRAETLQLQDLLTRLAKNIEQLNLRAGRISELASNQKEHRASLWRFFLHRYGSLGETRAQIDVIRRLLESDRDTRRILDVLSLFDDDI